MKPKRNIGSSSAMRPEYRSRLLAVNGGRGGASGAISKLSSDQESPSSARQASTTNRCNTNQNTYTCAGCNKPIKRDKWLLAACDKFWHENCLRCDRCHSQLGELGSSLFCKSNMILCRQDYFEMFGQEGVCSVCDKLISASEMVMRARQNVYHLECFACQLCNQRFCVGDRFYLCENKVVCEYDYEEHILPIQSSLIQQQQQQQQQQLLHQSHKGNSSLELLRNPSYSPQPEPHQSASLLADNTYHSSRQEDRNPKDAAMEDEPQLHDLSNAHQNTSRDNKAAAAVDDDGIATKDER